MIIFFKYDGMSGRGVVENRSVNKIFFIFNVDHIHDFSLHSKISRLDFSIKPTQAKPKAKLVIKPVQVCPSLSGWSPSSGGHPVANWRLVTRRSISLKI